jgi:hypothetical protein
MIRVVGPRESGMYMPDDPTFVNTTSRSKDWGRGLSPFLNGPCPLYPGAPAPQAFNVENAWQYSKVYKQHTDKNGDPSEEWYRWAKIGFLTRQAKRYPMGKGREPEYAFWNGEKLGYIESRKKIYIPVYSSAIADTEAFQRLIDTYKKFGKLTLWDFDGYDRFVWNKTLDEILNNEERPMGHAFVIEMMLRERLGDDA